MESDKDNYNDVTIPVYIINLPERKERLESILHSFNGHDEFEINVIPAIKCNRGAEGLWKTFISIIEKAEKSDDDVIIICEDDHVFTKEYDKNTFISEVIAASEQGCQMLLGGIGYFSNAVPISEHRLWIDFSWCTQFVVLFRNSFRTILDSKFGEKDVTDEFLSLLLTNKMVLYPFISIQKEFGYSDVTYSNNTKGRNEKIFLETETRIREIMNKYNQYCLNK